MSNDFVPKVPLPLAPPKQEDPFEKAVERQVKQLDFETGAQTRHLRLPSLEKKKR